MMRRRKIVAGNWKMNLSLTDAVELVDQVVAQAAGNTEVEKIFFPSFPFLKSIADLVIDEPSFSVGAQNCSEHEKGAYTGEVAAAMIRSVGCSYVLVGHSERRVQFGETAQQLLSKVRQAFANELHVIFCVGELLSERRQQLQFETVARQLKEVLGGMEAKDTERLVIAYEPVWAIGTGETASPEQAQEIHAFIRKQLGDIFSPEIAAGLPLLYGGSCNAQNARELFAREDVDGGLIGGASLKANDFSAIINSF